MRILRLFAISFLLASYAIESADAAIIDFTLWQKTEAGGAVLPDLQIYTLTFDETDFDYTFDPNGSLISISGPIDWFVEYPALSGIGEYSYDAQSSLATVVFDNDQFTSLPYEYWEIGDIFYDDYKNTYPLVVSFDLIGISEKTSAPLPSPLSLLFFGVISLIGLRTLSKKF